jgi:hypothetical protein
VALVAELLAKKPSVPVSAGEKAASTT